MRAWIVMADAPPEDRERCLREHTCLDHCLMRIAGGLWCLHCQWWIEAMSTPEAQHLELHVDSLRALCVKCGSRTHAGPCPA